MGSRKIRNSKVIHVGRYLHSWIERSQMKHDQRVQVVVEVTDGPDAGREVRLVLTPDETRRHIAHLWTALNDAEERSARGSTA
jgi:hypothetical protein